MTQHLDFTVKFLKEQQGKHLVPICFKTVHSGIHMHSSTVYHYCMQSAAELLFTCKPIQKGVLHNAN